MAPPLIQAGIAQGGNGWNQPLSAILPRIHALTSSVSLAYYPSSGNGATPRNPSNPSVFARAVLSALKLGDCNVAFHLDNGNEGLPWANPERYAANLRTLLTALSEVIPASYRPKLSTTVGNENLPPATPTRPVGNNAWTWASIRWLYGGLWRQCVGEVRNVLPGALAIVPGPGDQGPAYLAQAMSKADPSMPDNLPASLARETGADGFDFHYIFENCAKQLPGVDPNVLLDQARAYFGRPLSIGEFGWILATPTTTPATVAWAARHKAHAYYWEFSEPGGTELSHNGPVLRALGFGADAARTR